MREIASVVKSLSQEIQAVTYEEGGFVSLSDAYTGDSKGRMTVGALDYALELKILKVLAYKDDLPWDDTPST